jgi:hypothetical protein
MTPTRSTAPRQTGKKKTAETTRQLRRRTAAKAAPAQPDSPPFRFYDNRQKYLAFVNTCNEKAVVAARAAQELSQLHPTPPALRIFDAGMGDATVLTRLMSSVHHYFPTVPLLAVAKEISLEDVRLGLEKMPDRFLEHPHTVIAITNLSYVDAPQLVPHDPQALKALNWQTVRLTGHSAHEYVEQIEALAPSLSYGWQTKPSPTTGNPVYVRPSVLVIYRADHEFVLDPVIPKPGKTLAYDFALASQPWRAKTPAKFKAEKILAPLARSLAPGGRLLTIQSYGNDPALEVVQQLWPDENPFQVNRAALLKALRAELGREARNFDLRLPADNEALFQYQMHTLPSEIGDRIGTSTLFAAWNAVIYVNQIGDERLDPVVTTGSYLEATQAVLQKYGGLWFNDEAFVVTRKS